MKRVKLGATRLWAPLLVAVTTPLLSAGGPTVGWEASMDIAGQSDGGLIAVADGAGAVFTIGATPLFAGGEDMVIIKYDADGAEQWMTTYAGAFAGGYDYPEDGLVDAAGDLYITGQTGVDDVSRGQEWVTLKLSGVDGALLWERRFHGTGTFGGATARDMAMGPSGEIVVTGWARDDATWLDFGVVKYAPDGTELWARLFSSPGFRADSAEAVAVGPDGAVAVVGKYALSDQYIIGVVMYDADGALQWSRTYDASSFFDLEDRVRSVAIDGDGNVYVGADGIDSDVEGRDFVLLKYAADGTLLWDRRFTGTSSDLVPTVLLGPEGNIYLSGSSDGGHRLLAYDAAGNQLWTRWRSGSISSDATRDHAVLDAHGHVAVLLRTLFTPGITAFTIVRYAADGALVDETTIDPLGLTRLPNGLAAGPLGDLFATGYWLPDGSRDILTYQVAFGAPGRPGDLDGDGDVDLTDLSLLLAAFGSCSGDPTYNADADLDGSGCVELVDLSSLLASFGT